MTIVSALPLGWAVLAVTAAVAFRPRPATRSFVVPTAGGASQQWGARHVVAEVAELVGRKVLSTLRRPPATDDEARRIGLVTVVVAVGWLAHPLAGALLLGAGLCLPALAQRRAARARRAAIEAELPDLVDLFLLAVDAGLTVPLAVAAVARRAPGPLAAEFAIVAAEVDRGRRLADSLEQVPLRTADAVRPLTSVLVASERYGTPVAAALERLAVEVRIYAQRRAEEAARRVPVTLLFPLVLCILPAFALLTVAPLVANGLRSLRL